MKVFSEIKGFFEPAFNRYLVIALVLLGFLAFFVGTPVSDYGLEGLAGKVSVNFFYLPTCPHCAEQKPIISELASEMSGVSFVMHDASTPEGSQLFYKFASEAGMDLSRLAVPTTFVGKKPLVGSHSKEQIKQEILYCQNNCVGEQASETQAQQKAVSGVKEFELPFVGRTDLTALSLPALAIILGLIDGFNPCAMWVLVYLIALLINVNDKKKFWIIIGSFVLASGALYFLFMTAWLNAFLLLGYVKIVSILIGLIALGGGILSLKEYFTTKGTLTCKVGDEESHEKISEKIQKIISSPLSAGIIISIIALAFVVNSVEFVCSSAIPAVFTQVLAISNLGTLERYAYILLYDFFFMLDDLIVFGVAGLAVSSGIGEKYAKYCKAIGGIIMIVLGAMLLFAPHLLR